VVLAGATALALAVELARRTSSALAARFLALLGPLLRTGETGRLTGATSLAIGYTLAAVLLPGQPAVAGILFAGVGDAGAAVVGKRYGRVRYPGGKSLEGSLAFLALCFLIAMLVTGLGPWASLAAAAALTLLEAPSLRADDNLYLPLAGAALVKGLGSLVAPEFFS
jgi:dolichol kinase